MSKRKKDFIKNIVLINIATITIMFIVSYFIKNVRFSLYVTIIFLILIISLVINSINIIFYIKNKK